MKTSSEETQGDATSRARKSERRYLIRAMVVMLAAVVLGWTYWSFRSGGVMVRADERVLEWIGAHQSASLETAMRMVSAVATFPAIAIQVVAIGTFLARRAQWGLLIGLLIAVVAGSSLNGLTKFEIKRERPPVELAVRALTDYSFPSGHTAAATLLYGSVLVYASRRHRHGKRWLIIVAGCVGLIILVGFSRIYLRLHFVSDVVGGWAIGGVWLPCAITLGELSGAAIDSKAISN